MLPLKNIVFMSLVFILLFSASGISYALSDGDLKSIYTETTFYDPNSFNDCAITSNLASNSNVYIVGDSLSVGLQQNELAKKLKDKGYTDVSFNGVVGRSVYGGGEGDSALSAVEKDKEVIQKSGTILVVLGTNPDNYQKGVPELMKKINSYNGTARKFWVNVGVTRGDLQANMNNVNKVLNENSDEFNYKVIDWAAKVNSNKALISSDKVHPSAAGYNVLSSIIIDSFGAISSTPSNIQGNSNAEKTWVFLISKGLTPVQVAGIMGNLQQESGINPDNVNEIGAYGIAQWLGGRKDALFALASKQDKKPNDLQVQLDYMWNELSGPYSSVLSELKKANNLRDAVEIFLKKYEIPCGSTDSSCWGDEMKNRLPPAQVFLKKYAGISSNVSGCNDSLIAGGLGWDLEGTNKMVYYSQTDPKWANQKYGNCSGDSTIASSGCGPTSIAMIVATLTGNGITPPEIAKFAVENSFRTCGEGTDHGLGAAIAKKYNLKYSNIGTDFDKAVNILKQGGLVWVGVGTGTFTSDGHLMVIRKTTEDGQSFYLADPISKDGRTNGESNTKAYTRDELLGPGNLNIMYGFTK